MTPSEQNPEILLRADDVKGVCKPDEAKCFKYIRVGVDDFRFVILNTIDLHAHLATREEEENKETTSAGVIGIFNDTVSIIDQGSISLGVKWDPKDQELLPKLFGYKLKS